MNLNILKIISFIGRHAKDGVQVVEATKELFTNGADKKQKVRDLIEAAITKGAQLDAHESDHQLSKAEQVLALLPECREAYDALIEARVAVLKAEAALRAVLDEAREIHGPALES